jgi:transcriptional antiterminator
MIGLNFRLYNDIENTIRRLFQPDITITKTSVTRAIYFHGYLLEQTLQIFDISSLVTDLPNPNPTIKKELQDILCRQLLLLPKIIISKENLYSLSGNEINIRCPLRKSTSLIKPFQSPFSSIHNNRLLH